MSTGFFGRFAKGFKDEFHEARVNRDPIFTAIPKWSLEGVGGFVGRLASDVIGDETRNFLWRFNHPLGIASSIGSDALKVHGMPVGYQALGGAALSLGVLPVLSGNLDITNIEGFGRPKGYSALFPDENDPTKTTNPLGEFAGRYFLGRKGDLLPYEKLALERPDVTPRQYLEAKNSSGWGNKQFFGLENDIGSAIGIAAGIGAAIGAYQRRPEFVKTDKGLITRPRVVTHTENVPIYRMKKYVVQYSDQDKKNVVYKKEPPEIGRFWVDDPVRVEYGRPIDIAEGAIRGGVIGGLVGSTIPSLAQLGAIRSQTNLNGEQSVALLGYEVPLSSALLTTGGALGLRYWAKNRFSPNNYVSPDAVKWIDNYEAVQSFLGKDDREGKGLGNVGWNPATRKWEYGFTPVEVDID